MTREDMTTEEAVKYIRYCMCEGRLVGNTKPIIDEKWQAGVMAIKALEQKPCEDTISRKAVIEHICESKDCYKKNCKGILYNRCPDIEWVNELPTVTPQQKTG